MSELTKYYKLQKQKFVNGRLDQDIILEVHPSKEFLLSIMRDLQRMEEDPTIFYSVVWYQSVDISQLKQSL